MRSFLDFIAIQPDRMLELHINYSYKYLGLDIPRVATWFRTKFGRGTIINVLDIGVWLERLSFSDREMPLSPRKWRGVCQEG